MFTELESYQQLFSDLYKDVNGVRPRWCSEECFNSVEWLKVQIEELEAELVEQIKDEKFMQEQSVKEFEANVQTLIESGAGNRETALRWLFDAEEDDYCKYDRDYFCYTYNLPYGYFKGVNI